MKRRFLSLLLALAVVCALLPAVAAPANAADYSFGYAADCQRTPAFPKTSNGTVTLSGFCNPVLTYGGTTSGNASLAGNWTLTSLGRYSAEGFSADTYSRLVSLINYINNNYYSNSTPTVYELKKDGGHIAYGVICAETTGGVLFVGDTLDNFSGAGYFLSDESHNRGDTITVTVTEDLEDDVQPHTHEWTYTTDGIGTKNATAVFTCNGDDCEETFAVSLTASDVTLPGDVFNAEIVLGSQLRRIPSQLPEGFTVSETPGYKYSATGSGYEDIDPATFTAKAGYYQASIVINDAVNLSVKYTAINPTVTATTGDNRPIEMMVMGMVMFSALAAAAFVIDRKRG